MVLSWGQFCPPGAIWQCLKTSLVVTTGRDATSSLGDPTLLRALCSPVSVRQAAQHRSRGKAIAAEWVAGVIFIDHARLLGGLLLPDSSRALRSISLFPKAILRHLPLCETAHSSLTTPTQNMTVTEDTSSYHLLPPSPPNKKAITLTLDPTDPALSPFHRKAEPAGETGRAQDSSGRAQLQPPHPRWQPSTWPPRHGQASLCCWGGGAPSSAPFTQRTSWGSFPEGSSTLPPQSGKPLPTPSWKSDPPLASAGAAPLQPFLCAPSPFLSVCHRRCSHSAQHRKDLNGGRRLFWALLTSGWASHTGTEDGGLS